MMANYKQLILDLGSISGLLVLPYTVVKAVKNRPRLKFDFSGMSGGSVKKKGPVKDYYRFEFSGIIKNRSLETNSISKVYLVVWANSKKRNSVLRLGFGGILMDIKRKVLSLPLKLPPKEGKKLKVIFEIPVTGTSDEKILREVILVGNTRQFYMPKYKYELCFEDTDENFFDQQGNLRNLEEINLRWTLPNTIKALQKGEPVRFVKHIIKIQLSKLKFQTRKFAYFLGL